MKHLRNIVPLIERSEAQHGLKQLPWQGNPHIGWHEDGDHLIMYHGTHEKNLGHIDRGGINAPTTGPTANWVSMTHDPHTAHGYASMTGGESTFRSSKKRPQSVPHEQRAVLVARIPREWARANMDHDLRGNLGDARTALTDRSSFEAHKAAGKPDFQHYQSTELRFKNSIPRQFIQGYMKKVDKPS